MEKNSKLNLFFKIENEVFVKKYQSYSRKYHVSHLILN